MSYLECKVCPINYSAAEDDCFWIADDKSCRLKAEQDRRRMQHQVDSDRRAGESMRDYWMHTADGAER